METDLPTFLEGLHAHIRSVEDFLHGGEQRQQILLGVVQGISSTLHGTKIVAAKLKDIRRSREKCLNCFGGQARFLYDYNRVKVQFSNPSDVELFVRAVQHEKYDTGWELRNAGRISRQLIISIEYQGKKYASEIFLEMESPEQFPEYNDLKRMIYECRRYVTRNDKTGLFLAISAVEKEIDKVNERGLEIEKFQFNGELHNLALHLTRQSTAIYDVCYKFMSHEWRKLHELVQKKATTLHKG